MSTVSPSQASPGEEITASKVNTPVNQLATVINGQLDDNNISSVSGTKLVSNTLPATAFSDAVKGGWIDGVLTAPATTTYNGNGSYTWTYASSVAAYIAPFTRIRTLRATTAPTYMLTLNGSNQYATKATPSGSLGTVTNNFSLVAWVYPTAYQAGYACGRSDASANNALGLSFNSSGQPFLIITNGGVANVRSVTAYQSVQLYKKQFIVMTWSSGTVTAYLNGQSIPVATPSTGGTAPTTAGTGGDWSIGRLGAFTGASNYFSGSVSGVQVYDKVLSAAEVQALYSQGATGAETNCIGSWDLNNRATDQNAAGNNLTLTNSPSYTSGRAPFATDSSGVAGGSYDYGMVTSLSTDGKTVTLQVPEGCAFPTGASAISSVAYSPHYAPLGFPLQKERWEVATVYRAQEVVSIGATNTWFASNFRLVVPIGAWSLAYSGQFGQNSTVAGSRSPYYVLESTTPTNGTWNYPSSSRGWLGGGLSTTLQIGSYNKALPPVSLSVASTYVFYGGIDASTGTETYVIYGTQNEARISAIPAGI